MPKTKSILLKIAFLLLLGFTQNDHITAMQPNEKEADESEVGAKLLKGIAKFTNDIATKAARIRQEAVENRRNAKETLMDKMSKTDNQSLIKEYTEELAELRRDEQKEKGNADTVQKIGLQLAEKGSNIFLKNVEENLAKKRTLERAAQDKALDNKGALERAKVYINGLTAPQTMGFLALASVGVIAGYYGTKLAYQYIEARMGKPKLVRDSSRIGFFGWVKSQIYPTTQTRQIEDIVVSPDIETKTSLLSEDLFETNSYGLPFQNALFYGPPGTGKTEMAKTLAYLSGMDYAILSGADFAQFKNGEDITELHKLFDWANNSERGLILFIDEADACFRDRSTLSKEGVDLVNAFLSQTGTSSDKIMIILATNYEDELDAAVRSRIHKKIPFLLPEFAQRSKIIKQKLKKYISNDTRTYLNKDNDPVEASLTMDKSIDDKYIDEIAQKIENFSGRDIDQAISEMRLRAYRSGKNILTKEIVEYVVNDKIQEIKKDKLATEYQRQRKTKAAV
ncbi:MAG: AAA family ATPase [bacterium]